MLSMHFDELLYVVDLRSPEPATMPESDGIEPGFGCMILTLDMNMGWLLTITSIKKEPVGTDLQCSWH
jgi:hypothetical protein